MSIMKRESNPMVVRWTTITIITLALIISIGSIVMNKPLEAFKDKDITNFEQITLPNMKFYEKRAMSHLETDFNVMYNSMYVDTDTNKIILEPIADSGELNKLITELDTLDKFNDYIGGLIYDPAPMYNSPIVKSSDRINCYGYTLLAMSFLTTHFENEYYYEIVQDYVNPHIYLMLFDKVTEEFIRKIDLTIQPRLELTKES